MLTCILKDGGYGRAWEGEEEEEEEEEGQGG